MADYIKSTDTGLKVLLPEKTQHLQVQQKFNLTIIFGLLFGTSSTEGRS